MSQKLVHRGIRLDRTKIADALGVREKVFADAWEEENRDEHIVALFTAPRGILEALMNDGERFIPVSQETATAVATIMQWLGTNVGFAYLTQTLERAGYVVVDKKSYKELLSDLKAARESKAVT